MKSLKILLVLSFVYATSLASAFAASSSVNGGSSIVPEGESPYKSFSQTALGAGISLGFRLNLTEDIFTDSEDKDSKAQDHTFTEIEAFGNQFFSGELNQNFGGRFNLGYEINGFRIYGSGGYVVSTMDYQETGNPVQSVNAGAPFFGVGIGYDITKNIGVRLNSMFYNFDFTPKNSEYQSVEIDVSAITLGLALHF